MFTNLICLGVEKSGTTTLFNILKNSKDIFAIRKETEFFSYYNIKKNKSYHVNNLNEYMKLFNNYKNQKYILDVGTTYLPSPFAIHNIEKFTKNSKFIICIRSPIDRAYSRYWMAATKKYDLTNYSHHKFKNYFLNHGIDYTEKWNNIRNRGLYFNQIKKYFDKFDRNNFLIILYEDFYDASKLKKKICDFLQIEIDYKNQIYAKTLYSKNKILHKLFNLSFPFHVPDFFIYKQLKKIKKNLRSRYLRNYPTIDTDTKNFLHKFYDYDIKKTEKLLNLDLSHWYNSTNKKTYTK